MNMPNRIQAVDAQYAYGFVVAQSVHVEQQVNETVYPEIIYPQLVPVDTGANPFTKTVAYYSSDKFGKAGWINGNADDIPLAGTERTMFQTPVYTAAIGYAWGWEEVNYAALNGGNLNADDAIAARRAYEEMVQGVALKGDASKGFNGLYNYPGVTIVAAGTANWGAATGVDLILADVNTLIGGTFSSTGYTAIANVLLLPQEKLNLLATRRLGDTGETILAFLRRNNTYTAITNQPLDIRGLPDLATAGAGSTTRAIAYRRDPNTLKLHIPMPHRFLPVYQDGPLHWVVPGVFRLGGLDIRRPAEVRYMDGI